MANVYKVKITFDASFLDTYNEVKDFETHYQEKLMKVQALPEKKESDRLEKEEELAKLQVEYSEISSKIFTTDSYDVRIFYDEIILELLSYSEYDSANDYYIFPDSFSPMYAFSYIAKRYPKFLNYLSVFKLYKNTTVIVDFLKLK